jgi:exosortase
MVMVMAMRFFAALSGERRCVSESGESRHGSGGPSPAGHTDGGRGEWILRAVLGACIFGLLLFLYGFNGNAEELEYRSPSAILWMVGRWSGSGGDLSHGWFIPLVSAAAVWWNRRRLAAAPRQQNRLGLVLLAASLLLYLVGVRIQQTRLTLLSLIGILWAGPLYFWGWQVARELIFPAAYLLFCIPMSFLDSITFPLRLFASATAAGVLNGLGIAVQRLGTAIYSPAGGGISMDVADPCSGLRYLLAMTALTAAYAYFTQRTLLKKWLLFLASVPVAVAGNVARIVAIGVVAAAWGNDAAMGLYHNYSGYVVFSVAIGLMIGIGAAINAPWREKRRRCRPRAVN